MSTLKISRRYAKSLLATATEKNIVDEVSKDIALVGHIGDVSKDLRSMLRSPIIDVSVKKTVLTDVLGGKVNSLTMDFLDLLLEKRRGHLLREIVMEYGVMLDKVQNVERVRVTSAVELDDAQRLNIETSLAKRMNRTIVATYQVDPAILGGAIVCVGDDVLDGSLRHQLGVLRERLAIG